MFGLDGLFALIVTSALTGFQQAVTAGIVGFLGELFAKLFPGA
jgi:hypothetical protein